MPPLVLNKGAFWQDCHTKKALKVSMGAWSPGNERHAPFILASVASRQRVIVFFFFKLIRQITNVN